MNRINRRDRNNIDQNLFMNYESVGSIVQKLLWNWSDDSFASVQMLAKNFLNKQRRNRRDEEYLIREYSSFSSVSFSFFLRNIYFLEWRNMLTNYSLYWIPDHIKAISIIDCVIESSCLWRVSVDIINGKLYFGKSYHLMITRSMFNNSFVA